MTIRIRRLSALLPIALTAVALLPGIAGAAPANPNGTVVTGRVVDTAGHPLARVRVSFETNPLGDGDERTFVTTTAADGSYKAVRPASSDDPATVFFDGHDAQGPASAGYLTGYLLDAAGNRVVVSGHPGTRVTGRDVALAAGAGASGRVTTTAGVPLAHVQVDLLGNAVWDYAPDEPYAVTGRDGRWSVRALDLRGQTSVRVTFEFGSYAATGGNSPTGYPDACLGLVPGPCELSGLNPAPATVKLTPGRVVTGADIALPDAAQLHGRVTDAAGLGLSGGVVYAFDTERRGADGQPLEYGGRGTDAQGYWTWGALLPGTYAVCTGRSGTDVERGSVSHGRKAPWGYAAGCAADSPISAGVYAGTLYQLQAGDDVAVPDITAQANGAVNVHVVDGHGDPVRHATVQVGVVGSNGAFTLYNQATLANGHGPIGFVAPGRDSLCASAPGFVSSCPPAAGGPTVDVSPYVSAAAPTIVLTHA